MKILRIIYALVVITTFLWWPKLAETAEVPVAIFPLQELGESRHDVNLPLTRSLGERLAEEGTAIIDLDTVITFMANHRIRTVGHLETPDFERVRRELGAAFVLLGTVSEFKNRPEPAIGLTLNLVRTSDARTIWSTVESLSTGGERRILSIGQPESTEALEPFLLESIAGQWPIERINESQKAESLNIGNWFLRPDYVRPGDEVHARVQLEDLWVSGEPPQVFFKVRDQLYPATATATGEGSTYEASWLAGEDSARHTVYLHIEWPQYERVETALLGSYVVDGTAPLLDIAFRGVQEHGGMPVFSQQVVIVPQMLIREPLSRWRLAFFLKDEASIGEMSGEGNLPESFIWSGRGSRGDGVYTVVIEAWDRAGNMAEARKEVQLIRAMPQVNVALGQSEQGTTVGLEYQGKVPLKYWRLEMWTREGRILTQAEGRDLPVELALDMPEAEEGQELQGFLFFEDAMGKTVRRRVSDLFPKQEKEQEEKEPEGLSRSWVDEF